MADFRRLLDVWDPVKHHRDRETVRKKKFLLVKGLVTKITTCLPNESCIIYEIYLYRRFIAPARHSGRVGLISVGDLLLFLQRRRSVVCIRLGGEIRRGEIGGGTGNGRGEGGGYRGGGGKQRTAGRNFVYDPRWGDGDGGWWQSWRVGGAILLVGKMNENVILKSTTFYTYLGLSRHLVLCRVVIYSYITIGSWLWKYRQEDFERTGEIIMKGQARWFWMVRLDDFEGTG